MKNPLKVCHYLPGYPGREGLTSYATGLTGAMVLEEPGSCVILSQRKDGRPAPPGVEMVRVGGGYLSPFSVSSEVKNVIKSGELGADLFVLHGTYNPPMSALGSFLRSEGIPYIFIPHDPYVPELTRHHGIRKWVYWNLFEKRLIEGAAEVQLLHQSHDAALRRFGCKVPTYTVPNGSDLSEIEHADKAAPRDPDFFTGLYLGRMDQNQKGLDLLIHAWGRFLKRIDIGDRKPRLKLSGNDWHDRGTLERLTRFRRLRDSIEFTGPRKEPSVQVHAEADFVILPSRFDGFGLTITEAMLAGRPVLVSSRAGVADHVRQSGGGVVVEPTIEHIAKGLCEMWAKRAQLDEMGASGQKYVLDELSWSKVAKVTMKEYRRIYADWTAKQASGGSKEE